MLAELTQAAPRRTKGFTLLELLIVMAVSAITITTAVAVFVTMLNQRRIAERTLETYSSMAMAQSSIDYDVANAGYRFPAAAFAVRVVNNVSTTTSLSLTGLTGGSTLDVTQNCGPAAWGLALGSDVLEVAQGWDPEAAGSVQSVTGQTAFVMNSTNPLTNITGQPIVLFADNAGNACAARVTSTTVSANTSISITMLAPDFKDDSASATHYPNCPAMNMTVYRLGRRARYMVCTDPTNTFQQGVLYRQVSDSTGTFGTPERLQDGIADLQVGIRVQDKGYPTTKQLGGSGCIVVGTGSAASQYCICNNASACSGVDLNNQSPTFVVSSSSIVDGKSHFQWTRGLLIGLTAVSSRRVVTDATLLATTSGYSRPALLDHAAAGGTPDGYLYLPQQHLVSLTNLTMVVP